MKKQKHNLECHICSINLKLEEIPPVCPNCGADWVNPQSEMLTAVFECSFAPEVGRARLGTIRLTNKRLFFVKESHGGVIVGPGLLGWLIAGIIANRMNKRNRENKNIGFNIPIEFIASAEYEGLKSNYFHIYTKDNFTFKLRMVKKLRPRVKEAILHTISTIGGAIQTPQITQ